MIINEETLAAAAMYLIKNPSLLRTKEGFQIMAKVRSQLKETCNGRLHLENLSKVKLNLSKDPKLKIHLQDFFNFVDSENKMGAS